MKKEYRADAFCVSAKKEHVVEYFCNRDLALAWLYAMKENGASAGFLLKYAAEYDGEAFYNVEELVY